MAIWPRIEEQVEAWSWLLPTACFGWVAVWTYPFISHLSDIPIWAGAVLIGGFLVLMCYALPWFLAVAVMLWVIRRAVALQSRPGGSRKTIVSQIILALYALAVATACLYVPWLGSMARVRGSHSLEYAPLWDSPGTGGIAFVTVDYGRIGLELVALTVVAGVGLFLCGAFRGQSALVKAEESAR
jgi:hypothetical protein